MEEWADKWQETTNILQVICRNHDCMSQLLMFHVDQLLNQPCLLEYVYNLM